MAEVYKKVWCTTNEVCACFPAWKCDFTFLMCADLHLEELLGSSLTQLVATLKLPFRLVVERTRHLALCVKHLASEGGRVSGKDACFLLCSQAGQSLRKHCDGVGGGGGECLFSHTE